MSGGTLRLGVLGMSDGNGHPYSWSAIFNGFQPVAMASCPFPAITEYLSRQSFPRDAIPAARVTHVWAQDRAIAEHVAAASRIEHVVERYEEMIGEVDAILLARDDAERHLEMSLPFLDAGLPIYIDKPVALSRRDLDTLFAHQRYDGQIFSCSSMRFAAEFQLSDSVRAQLGEIRHVQARTPKYWRTYGVHLVDPVLNMLGMYEQRAAEVRGVHCGDQSVVTAAWNGLTASFACTGSARSNIWVGVFGAGGFREMIFQDSFASFKYTLEVFVEGVRSKAVKTPYAELAGVVDILERGMANGYA